MNRSADCIVVGAGLAGLFAAYCAAKQGARVIVLAAGNGVLAISGGCVDILGYVDGAPVAGNPLDAIARLPEVHPYRLMGRDNVEKGLQAFFDLCEALDWDFTPPVAGNHCVPTIMGTLKPTGGCPPSIRMENFVGAKHICVVGFEGMRDCQPALIAGQFAKQKLFAGAGFSQVLLPSPRQKGRSVNALDIARWLDAPEGRAEFVAMLRDRAPGAEAFLVPPVCGTQPSGAVWRELSRDLGAGIVEMLGMPPAVGGLRLRTMLVRAIRTMDISFVENAVVTAYSREGTRCTTVHTDVGDSYAASSFILATGGFLGNGLRALPGRVIENVFDLPVTAPENNMDWSKPEVFGPHAFARMGVQVNSSLVPVGAAGEELLSNVRVAGRALAGFDPTREKSGYGVALASAYHAAAHIQ